jgi:hypothetical protein
MAKTSLRTTRISSFKYVFIVFFEKKSDAKIYINGPIKASFSNKKYAESIQTRPIQIENSTFLFQTQF